MARAAKNAAGNGLADALAKMINNQAALLQSQIELNQSLAATSQRMAELERESSTRFARIEERLTRIETILVHHDEKMQALTDAIRGRFGFQPPEHSQPAPSLGVSNMHQFRRRTPSRISLPGRNRPRRRLFSPDHGLAQALGEMMQNQAALVRSQAALNQSMAAMNRKQTVPRARKSSAGSDPILERIMERCDRIEASLFRIEQMLLALPDVLAAKFKEPLAARGFYLLECPEPTPFQNLHRSFAR